MRDLHLGGGQSLVSEFSGSGSVNTVKGMASRGYSRLKRLRNMALTSKDTTSNTQIPVSVSDFSAADTDNPSSKGSDSGGH